MEGWVPPRAVNAQGSAISARCAFKTYGRGSSAVHVLKGLNMDVPTGTIYALLGASGCGKTTLLSCIVGRKRLDKGEILVWGHHPGTAQSGVPGSRVGYMPQEIALYPECTLEEMAHFFGRIHAMSSHDIVRRMHVLMVLLRLPTESRPINQLSGGQQRRASFLIALLHEPELLILDEPTVGVDPLLRKNVWKHLGDLCREGTTVVITTHYIEEARLAHTVALMRGGHLLAEQEPEALLRECNAVTLEQVFLMLCIRQEEGSDDDNQSKPKNDEESSESRSSSVVALSFSRRTDTGEVSPTVTVDGGLFNGGFVNTEPTSLSPSKTPKLLPRTLIPPSVLVKKPPYSPTLKSRFFRSIFRVNAVVRKNLTYLRHNITYLLTVMALPAVQVILFGLAIGSNPHGIKLAVVNDEFPAQPICDPYDGCPFVNLSCGYLEALNPNIVTLKPYSSVQEAEEAVKIGQAWGVLYFPANFSDDFLIKNMQGWTVDEATMEGSLVRVRLDMSNQGVSLMLQRHLLFTFMQHMKVKLAKCDMEEVRAETPVKFEEPIFGNEDPMFQHFVAPGIIILIAFFMSSLFTVLNFIIDRREGMLDRIRISGLLPGEIIAGLMVTQLVILSVQTLMVLILILVVFSIPSDGSIVAVVFIIYLQGLCGSCFGFCLSAISENEHTLLQILLASFYGAFILGGAVWPLEAMPNMMAIGSSLLPSTLATESLRNVMLRGWDFVHPDVWPGFAVTVGWCMGFLLVTFGAIRLRQQSLT